VIAAASSWLCVVMFVSLVRGSAGELIEIAISARSSGRRTHIAFNVFVVRVPSLAMSLSIIVRVDAIHHSAFFCVEYFATLREFHAESSTFGREKKFSLSSRTMINKFPKRRDDALLACSINKPRKLFRDL
jgi:hypothetical protein